MLLLRTYLPVTLVLMALLVKLAVPIGFMPVLANGQMIVTVCTGMGQRHMAIDIPGMATSGTEMPKGADAPCSFAGMSDNWLAGVDPWLLAAALSFILLLALGPWVVPLFSHTGQLRPPLRGPPLNT